MNPICVPTRRAYGSLLHAHLRNVLYAKATLPQPPTHVLLTAANLYWIAPGVETYIRAVGSSVYNAPRVALPATHPPDLDPAWASIRRRLPFDGALQQKHEGSFYPWDAVVRMVHTIDLNRLNHRSCFCGGFCIEEYYLPNLFYLLERDRRFTFRTELQGGRWKEGRFLFAGTIASRGPGPAEELGSWLRRQAPRPQRQLRAVRDWCGSKINTARGS